MPININMEKGRQAVDAYRLAHSQLHQAAWHKGVPEEHTPLLVKMVEDLELQGFTSTETKFEPRKTEVLAKFFAANEELNLLEASGDIILAEGMWR